MALPTLARRAVTLGAPLVLGLIELGHPALTPSDNIVDTLQPIATWWTALHIAQIPLFALLGCAVWLTVRDLDGRAARVSRGAIAIFIVVYPAFDAAVGVASGLLMQEIGAPTPATRAAIDPFLQGLFWGSVTGTLALIGSLSWLVALVAAALAWRRASAPWVVVALLALSGVLLAIAHIRPFGPLACLAFLFASGWVEFGRTGPARA
jgi:hypothetical protein